MEIAPFSRLIHFKKINILFRTNAHDVPFLTLQAAPFVPDTFITRHWCPPAKTPASGGE